MNKCYLTNLTCVSMSKPDKFSAGITIKMAKRKQYLPTETMDSCSMHPNKQVVNKLAFIFPKSGRNLSKIRNTVPSCWDCSLRFCVVLARLLHSHNSFIIPVKMLQKSIFLLAKQHIHPYSCLRL